MSIVEHVWAAGLRATTFLLADGQVAPCVPEALGKLEPLVREGQGFFVALPWLDKGELHTVLRETSQQMRRVLDAEVGIVHIGRTWVVPSPGETCDDWARAGMIIYAPADVEASDITEEIAGAETTGPIDEQWWRRQGLALAAAAREGDHTGTHRLWRENPPVFGWVIQAECQTWTQNLDELENQLRHYRKVHRALHPGEPRPLVHGYANLLRHIGERDQDPAAILAANLLAERGTPAGVKADVEAIIQTRRGGRGRGEHRVEQRRTWRRRRSPYRLTPPPALRTVGDMADAAPPIQNATNLHAVWVDEDGRVEQGGWEYQPDLPHDIWTVEWGYQGGEASGWKCTAESASS